MYMYITYKYIPHSQTFTFPFITTRYILSETLVYMAVTFQSLFFPVYAAPLPRRDPSPALLSHSFY